MAKMEDYDSVGGKEGTDLRNITEKFHGHDFGDWMVASKRRSPGNFHDSCLSYKVDNSTLTRKRI